MGHGSPLSVSIDTTPPKGIYSIASLPRMNLNGRMELVQGKKEVLPHFFPSRTTHISVISSFLFVLNPRLESLSSSIPLYALENVFNDCRKKMLWNAI